MPECAAALPAGSWIGMLGGGQLGRMAAMAAARLGYRVHVFTPEHDAPASHVSAATTVAEFDDTAALRRFAHGVDVITLEWENVPVEALDLLGIIRPVHPGREVLRIAQDRIVEKTFLNDIGIATAPWEAIDDPLKAALALDRIGVPAILKTTRLGYDGKGQARVTDAASLPDCLGALAEGGFVPLIAEAVIDFTHEISVVVARDQSGTIACFDPVENHHRDHILEVTYAPASIAASIADSASRAARLVAEAIGLVGVLCVEFFVTGDGRLLANEIAPRPHNSGHWTIEACTASQFEQQIRAVAGLPLGDPSRHGDAVMRNLIGAEIETFPDLLGDRRLVAHHYGKAEWRPGRKMGHVTRLLPLGALGDRASSFGSGEVLQAACVSRSAAASALVPGGGSDGRPSGGTSSA